MKTRLQLFNLLKKVSFGFLLFTAACNDDLSEVSSLAEIESPPLAVNSDFGVYFSSTAGTYWSSNFISDFGNVSGYSNAERVRHYKTGSTLRVKLEKNKIGQDGGAICDVALSNKQQYIISYKVKFQNGFDWAIGGKIPGLGGGKVYAGGEDPSAGDGWSFRPVWHQYSNVNNGNPFLAPYAYYVDQPGTYGNEFSKRYTITDNTWYTVWIRVKMNTGSSSNGIIHMKVNNSTVYYDGSFRWVTQNSGREIDELMWDIFRGGAGSAYESSVDNYIYFDNFVIDAQ